MPSQLPLSLVSVLVGDDCHHSRHCLASIKHSVCTGGSCSCQLGYSTHASRTQCARLRVGDACSSNISCSLVVDYGACVEGRCACASGYHYHSADAACTSRLLYSACANHTTCSDASAHAHCSSSGQCECASGYDVRGDACTPKTAGRDVYVVAGCVAAICVLTFIDTFIILVLCVQFSKKKTY